jgi:hypothetical protein
MHQQQGAYISQIFLTKKGRPKYVLIVVSKISSATASWLTFLNFSGFWNDKGNRFVTTVDLDSLISNFTL